MLSERLEHRYTPSTKPASAIGELLVRIQGEYREMPGLMLTEAQAQRLWGLDRLTCTFVLGTLVERNFLRRTHLGTYLRSSE
jgi:hypothetical protein